MSRGFCRHGAAGVAMHGVASRAAGVASLAGLPCAVL
jgi:hypothetical protein